MVIASEAFGRDGIETVYAHNPERCFVKYSPDGKYDPSDSSGPY